MLLMFFFFFLLEILPESTDKSREKLVFLVVSIVFARIVWVVVVLVVG